MVLTSNCWLEEEVNFLSSVGLYDAHAVALVDDEI